MILQHGDTTITSDGAICRKAVNRTGSLSVKGMIVRFDSVFEDLAFIMAPVSCTDSCAIVYDDAIPDGDICRVVIGGVAQILLESVSGTLCGNWVKTSDTEAGRADGSIVSAPIGLPLRYQQIGQSLECKGPGELVRVKLQIA